MGRAESAGPRPWPATSRKQPLLRIIGASRSTVDRHALAAQLARSSRWLAYPLNPGEWGILSVPDRGAPHWLADLRGLPEAEARRSWVRCWSRTEVVGSTQVLVCCGELPEADADAAPAPGPVPPQLELHHFAPEVFPASTECVECGGPVEQYPGRDGRPRRACETCRPPEWPRRGERWLLDGIAVEVLGSRMVRRRPDAPRSRQVRVRELETGTSWTLTGAAWRLRSNRPPRHAGEVAA